MEIVIDIFKLIVLILITFFTCQNITENKKRISYIGTILICFSSAIIEYRNAGLIEALIAGELIFLSFSKLLENKKYYFYAIAIAVGVAGFLLLSNISFQIPIGITMLILILWKYLEYRKELKEKNENLKKLKKPVEQPKYDKKMITLLSFGLIIAIILGCVFYQYRPIKSLENRNGLNYLLSYTYDSLIVFDRNIQYENSTCLATFVSIFPAGLLISIWYIFKEENKHINFILPTAMVSILELIWITSGKTISWIPTYIFVLGFQLLQIYMLIYIFARMEEKMFNMTKSAYVALIVSVLCLWMPIPPHIRNNMLMRELAYSLFIVELYIALNYSDRRFWRLASWVVTVICLFTFISYGIVKFV